MKFLFLCLFLSLSFFGFSNETFDNFQDDSTAVYYVNSIAQSIQSSNFGEAELLLDQWEREQGSIFPGTILGLRSALLIIYGEFDDSISMIEKALPFLREEGHREELLNCIKSVYNSQSFQDMLENPRLVNASIDLEENSLPFVQLCKRRQPKGLCFKYWFGAAMTAAGCLVTPFCPPAGGAMITMGVGFVANAAGDCMDNDERQRQLNERQRIGAENMSFSPRFRLQRKENYYPIAV